MIKQHFFLILLVGFSFKGLAQRDSLSAKKRLDFAKMYFEIGGNFSPSFTGKRLLDNDVSAFKNSASINQYLSWGAFHFWGHAEFYVNFQLNQENFEKSEETDFELTHSVVTGVRLLPWAFQEKKIRTYVGVNWSSIDFQQKIKPEEHQPVLSKDFLLVPEAGLMYGYKGFMLRLGASYFHANKWNYPISKTRATEIKTPKLNFQIGLNYSFENSTQEDPKVNERWNSYPQVSRLGYATKKFGDLFVGVGPSLSFSLSKSEYNQSELPYIKNQLTSTNYLDISVGYQFNKSGIFTALSFRNPAFKAEGYGTTQTINKTSLTLETNKFLTDYSGFAPFVGVNVAYDRIKYKEYVESVSKKIVFNNVEPGISFGWDIVPGKTDEALILRTNLRWYPLSSFEIDGKIFDFSQLEYNLIQFVFYPGRLKTRRRSR